MKSIRTYISYLDSDDENDICRIERDFKIPDKEDALFHLLYFLYMPFKIFDRFMISFINY